MRDEESGELKLAKVTKMRVTRIALCKEPAVQEAEFVLVKSADDEEQLPDATDTSTSSSSTGGDKEIGKVDEIGGDAAKSVDNAPELTTELTTEQIIEAAVEKAISAKLSKTPVPAGSGMLPASQAGWTFVDGEEAAAIQKSITELVQTCNESTIVPRGVKALVGTIAKYHGVEGPDVSDETVFSEFVSQMKALLPVMQQMVVAMAKAQPPVPAAPAAPAPAAPKPAATAKSEDQVPKEGENEGSEEVGKAKKKPKQETDSDAPGAAEPVQKGCSSGAHAEVKETIKKEEAPPELVAQLAHKQQEIEALKKAVDQLTRETTKALGRDPDYRPKQREKTKAA